MNFYEFYNILNEISNTEINNTIWYHGGPTKYEKLISGNGGIDGDGIYLTKDPKRATLYAKKDQKGNPIEGYLHKVKINIDSNKIWDCEKIYDLRDYSKENWVQELYNKYGENGVKLDGCTAREFLFGKDNSGLRNLGFQAILNNNDLVVLDDNIIISVD